MAVEAGLGGPGGGTEWMRGGGGEVRGCARQGWRGWQAGRMVVEVRDRGGWHENRGTGCGAPRMRG